MAHAAVTRRAGEVVLLSIEKQKEEYCSSTASRLHFTRVIFPANAICLNDGLFSFQLRCRSVLRCTGLPTFYARHINLMSCMLFISISFRCRECDARPALPASEYTAQQSRVASASAAIDNAPADTQSADATRGTLMQKLDCVSAPIAFRADASSIKIRQIWVCVI